MTGLRQHLIGRRWPILAGALGLVITAMATTAPADPSSATIEILLETVQVDTRTAGGSLTVNALEPLTTYRFEVSGSYHYMLPNASSEADAECSVSNLNDSWRVNRWDGTFTPEDPKSDPLDLQVDGGFVDWIPAKGLESPAGSGCSDSAHTYDLQFEEGSGAPVRFSVWDAGYTDNVGLLTIKVYVQEIAPQVAETSVDSADSSGAIAKVYPTGQIPQDFVFRTGRTYRIEVGGIYSYVSVAGYTADAECSTVPAGGWDPHRFDGGQLAPAMDKVAGDNLDLYVDGGAVDWIPGTDTGGGCSAQDHIYSVVFAPSSDRTVRFQINDAAADNSGTLQVKVFELPPGAAQPTVAVPDAQAVLDDLQGRVANTVGQVTVPDVLTPPNPDPLLATPVALREAQVAAATVDSGTVAGAVAEVYPAEDPVREYVFKSGRTYRIEVSGTFSYSPGTGYLADAECSIVPGETIWTAHRYDGGTAAAAEDPAVGDPLDLYVDGKAVDWAPTAADGGCNPVNHVYQVSFAPGSDKTVRFQINDSATDNAGTLSVKVFIVTEVALESVVIDSRDQAGAMTQNELQRNTAYRFVASQTYMYSGPGYEADAECSRASGDSRWLPDRWTSLLPPPDDLTDLYVDGSAVGWTPSHDDGNGCNTVDHVYVYELPLSAITAPRKLRFNVADTWGGDNGGALVVQVLRDIGPA